jgi:hypothetical protein
MPKGKSENKPSDNGRTAYPSKERKEKTVNKLEVSPDGTRGMIDFTNSKKLGESFVMMSVTEGGTPSMLTVHHPIGVHQFRYPKEVWIATSSDRVQDLINEGDADLSAFRKWSGAETTKAIVESGFAQLGPYGPKTDQVYYTEKCLEGVNLLETFPHAKELDPSLTEPGTAGGNPLTVRKLAAILERNPRNVWLDCGEENRKRAYVESKEYKDYLAQQHEHDHPKDPRKKCPKPNKPKMPDRDLFLYSFVATAEEGYTRASRHLVDPAVLMSLFVVEQGFATMVRAHQIMQKPIHFLQGMSLEEARMTYASLLLQPHMFTVTSEKKVTGEMPDEFPPAKPPPEEKVREYTPMPAPPPPPPMPSNATAMPGPLKAIFSGPQTTHQRPSGWATAGPFAPALADEEANGDNHQDSDDGPSATGDASGYDPVVRPSM